MNESTDTTTPVDGLLKVSISEEMRSAYLDYAMSVIIGRAIPDVRDGLKPVHRRILYAMYEAKNFYNQPYRKSARVVGDVIGKYHPHGDAAVYDALVRMAQDFSMRQPLVDGQGNFGSLDGDPPAAMRYTEVRLTQLAHKLLESLDQETVDWAPNYDESLLEPRVLPAQFPNLLVNGAKGIAVGMVTNIPPHNLGEVIEAVIAVIKNPSITIEELMKIVPGPDFPTGGVIMGVDGIKSAYTTGQGSIIVRAVATIEEDEKKGRNRIIVTEIPYQVNKSKILERIAELVKEKKITGVSDIRDESNREGVRIVIDLKRDSSANVVLNQLFKLTPLQDTFDVKNLAIVRGQPKIMNLKETLEHFIEFRIEVVTRRTRFELKKAEERLHILEGLRVAVDNIDEVISIIRSSGSTQEAEERLMLRFSLSDKQAKAILEMRLARLTGLERKKIEDEMTELGQRIGDLMDILSRKARLQEVIINELEELKSNFGNPRRTSIEMAQSDIKIEDLIPEEKMVVAVSHLGYIKSTPVSVFRAQGRGGKGVVGMETREEDFISKIYVCSSHDKMLFFSDRGKVYSKNVYEIPQAQRSGRGKAIVNFVGMEPGEGVAAVLPVMEIREGLYVLTATKRGYVKKSDIMLYSNIRSSGIIGVVIDEGDSLIGAALTTNGCDVLLCTARGRSVRFREEEVRPSGRVSRGVIGIRLSEGDEVVAMAVLPPSVRITDVECQEEISEGEIEEEEAQEGEEQEVETHEEHTVLTICKNGYGKRTNLSEHRCQGRGGKGIIAIRASERNGPVVGMSVVKETDDVMIVTTKGKFIRTPVSGISVISRNTQGVRLIKLEEEEHVATIDRITSEEESIDSGFSEQESGGGDKGMDMLEEGDQKSESEVTGFDKIQSTEEGNGNDEETEDDALNLEDVFSDGSRLR